jgi:iron(III)-enterobactin esterase
MAIRPTIVASCLASIALLACGEGSTSPMGSVGSGTGTNSGSSPSDLPGGAGAPSNETGGQPASNGGTPVAVSVGGTTNAMGGTSSGGAANAMGGNGQGGASESYVEDVGTEGDGDFVVGEPYGPDPELEDQGNPKGNMFEFLMNGADSTIFKGEGTRRITVYVPAAYVDGTEAPVLVMLDGGGQMTAVRNALDNLTISQDPARKLPPFIAIGVQNGVDDRSFEYDTMNDSLARFVNDEVFPAILSDGGIKAAFPKIAFTANPWGRATMGCSSGGAGAFSMGWFRPDLFRRVIGYSTTLTDVQDGPGDNPEEAKYPLGAWEYHSSMELIRNTEAKPLRIFIHVSENDLNQSANRDWVTANQRTAAALAAKNYHYRFVTTEATEHCEGLKIYPKTLADTLVWLWRGYHAD